MSSSWEDGTTQRPDEAGLLYPSSLRFNPSDEEYNNPEYYASGGEREDACMRNIRRASKII
jgi:hypothetical protein